MKESNFLVTSVINNILHSKIWSNTREYIRESNALAGNAPIKQVQRDILMNIKGQSMKDLNTLVYSAEKN